METTDAIRAFAALAQDTRLGIFRLLVRVGPSGLTAGEIGRAAGIGATSLSFHLKELDRAGLVTQSREGRFVRYAIHVEGVRGVIEYLTEDCCSGNPELCGAAFNAAKGLCEQDRGRDE